MPRLRASQSLPSLPTHRRFGDFVSAVSAAAAQRRRLTDATFVTQAANAHAPDVYPNYAHEIRRKCVEARGLAVTEDIVDLPPAVLNGLVPWKHYQARHCPRRLHKLTPGRRSYY